MTKKVIDPVIGKRIKYEREAKGMSQAALAKRLNEQINKLKEFPEYKKAKAIREDSTDGISVQTIQNWEYGKNSIPQDIKYQALANIFEVRIEYIKHCDPEPDIRTIEEYNDIFNLGITHQQIENRINSYNGEMISIPTTIYTKPIQFIGTRKSTVSKLSGLLNSCKDISIDKSYSETKDSLMINVNNSQYVLNNVYEKLIPNIISYVKAHAKNTQNDSFKADNNIDYNIAAELIMQCLTTISLIPNCNLFEHQIVRGINNENPNDKNDNCAFWIDGKTYYLKDIVNSFIPDLIEEIKRLIEFHAYRIDSKKEQLQYDKYYYLSKIVDGHYTFKIYGKNYHFADIHSKRTSKID